jgi:hypothetical protein
LLLRVTAAREENQNENQPKDDAHEAQCSYPALTGVGTPNYRAKQHASAPRQSLTYRNSQR